MLISYTLSSQIIYVDQNAAGSNNGTDWANAYTDLQTAIANIGTNTTINVAQGTYYPTATSDRTIYFNIPRDKELFGGFPTGGGTRNPELYPTILSGDIGTIGDNTDNSYHVVYFYDTSTLNEFDGFIIEKGYADGTGTYEYIGGGIFINTTDSGSYGVYIRNCTVRNNYARYGGGISAGKQFKIYNCKIYSNHADEYGGGLTISTSGNIYNSYIVNNSAGNYGGGIYLGGSIGAPRAINCVIANNESLNGTGAYQTKGYLINCTIANNKGNYGVNSSCYNSIIWGNDTNQIDDITGSENNIIQDFTSSGTNLGIANVNNGAVFGENYSRFTNPTSFTGNATTQEQLDEILNADWSINPQSAAIDFGDNSLYPTIADTPTIDIIGNTRTINTTMDAGAYESLTNIITNQATNQQPTSADLNGEILFAETSNTITRGFVYDINSDFDVTTATSVTNASTGLGVYLDNITGLTENQLYYYRTWVEFDGIKYYGNEIQFNASNLIAYYPFNGNANDESGNKHNGTVNGPTLTTGKSGDVNSAYYYDGVSNNNIDIGAWENGGAMTFNLWVKWNSFTNWGLIMDLSLGANNNNIYIGNKETSNILMFHTLDGSTKYLFYCDDTTTYPNSPLTLNVWTMITCTVDESGLMKAYKNGEQIGSFNGFTPTKTIRTVQNFGSFNYPENGYFHGSLDNISIYNKALTDTEVLTLYNTETLAVTDKTLEKNNTFYVNNNTLYFKNTQNLDEIKSVEVFNLLGQKVYKTSVIENQISITTLQKGIYILKIEDKNSNYNSLKFIIY